MSSLRCAHAATDSLPCAWYFHFLSQFHITISGFHFIFILLVTFDVSGYLWGWYNCTKVQDPKLHHWGKRLNQLWLLVWNHFYWSGIIFFGWHGWFRSSSLYFRVVYLLCHAFICYGFGFISIFWLCLQYLLKGSKWWIWPFSLDFFILIW